MRWQVRSKCLVPAPHVPALGPKSRLPPGGFFLSFDPTLRCSKIGTRTVAMPKQQTPAIHCPTCNVAMGVKSVIRAAGQSGHVVYACVICKAETTRYFNAPDAPAPANDAEPKPP